jgi:glycosyltransferase involved in cell wall biosynthesis
MRILHVIPSVGPLRGGPSVTLRAMARGLSRAGCEVHVATTDDDGPGRLHVPHGVPLTDDGVTFWHFRRQTRFYQASWPLTRWLARHVGGYDLVHVHALFSYAALPAAWAARRAGIPYVVRPLGTLSRWGMAERHPRLKRLSLALVERRILRGAACVHYTSEAERLEAAELGIDGRSAVVPLGVALGRFDPLPPRGWLEARAPHLAGRPVALFLSRLDRKKGLELLLEAVALAKARGTPLALVVAGTGDRGLEARLRGEAARLGIERDVVWAGFVTGEEQLAVLAAADLFVLPSHSENFGVSVVEAMACGLPVVVSDQVGIHREIAEAGAGLVVPCRADALAEALMRLGEDATLRCRIGQRARRLAGNEFSVERMVQGLIDLYSSVLSGRPVPVAT